MLSDTTMMEYLHCVCVRPGT